MLLLTWWHRRSQCSLSSYVIDSENSAVIHYFIWIGEASAAGIFFYREIVLLIWKLFLGTTLCTMFMCHNTSTTFFFSFFPPKHSISFCAGTCFPFAVNGGVKQKKGMLFLCGLTGKYLEQKSIYLHLLLRLDPVSRPICSSYCGAKAILFLCIHLSILSGNYSRGFYFISTSESQRDLCWYQWWHWIWLNNCI